ncbi:PAQR family membrane homeostasis protein TrhA [Allorhizocola rhizosphaerae]|uniref:PAQR family membrane homeostasis protein TrhA n=1 Tax=Allorhizocola rhizosphaerae TaxID=1872709 RepID=UPI000E3DCF4C|nr:hemolysin III family protein [Allorhizocola rhizosphaerae]
MSATITRTRLTPMDIGKPRLRGWLHFYAFFAAIACGIVLVAIAPSLGTFVYSLTVCGLFGISALYHRRVWTERGYQTMRRLDHAMIFLFIAGTYTPFCALLLPPAKATLLLTIVWAGAVGGALMSLIWPHAPRWVSAPLYLALGWVAVAVLPDISHHGGVTALLLLLAGGAAYSLGAICYALKRPNPWPKVFGHHEFFHACTLVAAICHHIAIYFALFA